MPKKQPLTLKYIEKDTQEPFCMTHNHCLLYNQSQNNISKETFFFKTNRQVKPSKPLWQIDYMWRPIRACTLKVSICHLKVLFGGLSASLTGRGQWIEGMRKLLLGEVARKCWMAQGKIRNDVLHEEGLHAAVDWRSSALKCLQQFPWAPTFTIKAKCFKREVSFWHIKCHLNSPTKKT